MMSRWNLHRGFNIQQFDDIVQDQQTGTALKGTHKIYIAKCKVMANRLNDIPDILNDALIIDSDGIPSEYKGSVKGVFTLILPILPNTLHPSFFIISTD